MKKALLISSPYNITKFIFDSDSNSMFRWAGAAVELEVLYLI